ncbi:MAG: nucleoid-associated protein [Paludibacteraceae bacterium]|nr:nucleoid-associated protein [Paludibacteraceae bacterium]
MLFDIINANIEKMVIHKIGSRTDNTENTYSKKCMDLASDSPIQMLKQYFLSSFREPVLYHFEGLNHVSDNIVYKSACAIFDNPELFYEHSRILASHLYESSTHPQIKSGEFYLVLFNNVRIFDEDVRCLGIFKSENKETYLKIYPGQDSFDINCEEGINIRKMDKGCLIFDVERESGFVASLVDKVSKQEALYWKNDFLSMEERQDNNFFTKNYLDMCKGFVNEVFTQEGNVPRTDQIGMLNRSINYFKDNTMFSEDKFNDEVLAVPEVVDAFSQYRERYADENDVSFGDEFKISPEIVKKENKNFKSVLKLDKNFHLYIHGGHQFIEKGFDEQHGLHYYKLYFERES